MDCESINDDVLDEIVLGRANDPALSQHLATCGECSERLHNRRLLVGKLRDALGQQDPRCKK